MAGNTWATAPSLWSTSSMGSHVHHSHFSGGAGRAALRSLRSRITAGASAQGMPAAPAALRIHLGRLACPVVSLQLKKTQQQQQTQARWERCAEPFCKESSPGHPGMIYTIIHHRTVTRQKQMQQRGVMTQLDLDGPPYVEIFITPHSLQPLFSELTIPPAR